MFLRQVSPPSSRHSSTKTVKMALRSWQGHHNPSGHTPHSHLKNSCHTQTTKNFRNTKHRILQELQTNFRNKAIRNISSHQLSPIETEVLGLGLNFVPTPLAFRHHVVLKSTNRLTQTMKKQFHFRNQVSTLSQHPRPSHITLS